jgi:ACS family glucarate transporter-like MFS transporter
MFAGSRLGAAGAFPLMAWLLERFGWRSAFYVLALPGIVWVAGWWLLFRDRPAVPLSAAPRVSQEKSFAGVMRSRIMALAMVQYFATNFTTFLTLSWMNPYLKQQFHLSAADAAWFSMWPLLFGASSQWITGTLIDRLYRSTWRSWSRALPAILGFTMSGAGMLWLAIANTPETAVAAFVLAAFGADMTISPGWAFCLDIGGRNSGAVSGAMNMAGNLGSFVSANAFPYLFNATGGVAAYCGLTAAMSLVSIACWLPMRRSVK